MNHNGRNHNGRVFAWITCSIALVVLVWPTAIAPITSADVFDAPPTCDQGPANPPASATYHLEDFAADWGVYCLGTPTWVKENATVPSLDGRSLRGGLTGGAAYSNVHFYRHLLSEPAANRFTLNLSFYFAPPTTFNNQGSPSVIQALVFTMNKWYQSRRYEFAVRWQNVGTARRSGSTGTQTALIRG